MKWISAKDRLPELNQKVVIVYTHGDYGVTAIATFCGFFDDIVFELIKEIGRRPISGGPLTLIEEYPIRNIHWTEFKEAAHAAEGLIPF